jgi:hypothetical protein
MPLRLDPLDTRFSYRNDEGEMMSDELEASFSRSSFNISSFLVHRSITRISGFSIADCLACPPYFDDRSEETA